MRIGRIGSAGSIAAAVAISTTLVLASTTSAAQSNPEYTVYAGCGRDQSTPPSHFCHKGEPLGAFFRSNSHDAIFDVCMMLPIRLKACSYGQQATQGVLYVSNLTTGINGPITINWMVGGFTVGNWKIDVFPDPIVPKFGVSPLIVARTHRLYGLVLRHIPIDLRVRAWRKCDGVCRLPLRLISSRGETRRYRISTSPVGAGFQLGTVIYVQVDAPGKLENENRVWGRVYQGRLVRDQKGGPRDTAMLRVGKLLCTPPGSIYRAATTCDQVSG